LKLLNRQREYRDIIDKVVAKCLFHQGGSGTIIVDYILGKLEQSNESAQVSENGR
jgi:hypothetical protein